MSYSLWEQRLTIFWAGVVGSLLGKKCCMRAVRHSYPRILFQSLVNCHLDPLGFHLALQPGGKRVREISRVPGQPCTGWADWHKWWRHALMACTGRTGAGASEANPHSLQSVFRNCVLCFFVVCIGGKTPAVRALHHRWHPTILWLFTSCKIFAIIYLYNFMCCHILSVNSDESYTNISVTYYFYTDRTVVRVAHDNLPIPTGGFEGSKQSSPAHARFVRHPSDGWRRGYPWLFWITCGEATCLASCKLPFALTAEVCSLMMELETSYVQLSLASMAIGRDKVTPFF